MFRQHPPSCFLVLEASFQHFDGESPLLQFPHAQQAR